MAKIFISYSHEDEDWLNYVRSHLRTAEFAGAFELWDDRKLMGGDDWEAEIAKALAECRVCILLVSRHSLTSDYINRVEMRTALERAQSQGVRIYPIFVSSTYVPNDHWLKKFNWRPTDGEPLQSLPSERDERDKAMVAIVAEIVELAAASPRVGAAPHAAAPIIDLSALPDTSLVTLRGREAELARLNVAWDDPSIHVFSVVAWGGQGKTALVSTWVDRLKAEGGRGAEALLAWSFYDQGSKERAASADRFLDWALKKLVLPDPGPSATARAETIAEALQARRVLLILDGVEPLQHGPGPQEGQLKDPAMRVLLRRAAADGVGGRILLTTRLAVQDIAGRRNAGAPVLDLAALSEEAGAALLEDRGCKGPSRELRAAAKEFGGHALALTLLSGFLVRRCDGNIQQRDRVKRLFASGRPINPVHAQAQSVMQSMDEEWLRDAPLHAAIMRAIGLFDRPASGECLEALRREPALPGLEAWQTADGDACADAIFELREAGLLLREDEQAPATLDAHPLAREWYGEKFKRENEAGFEAAHGRVYEHLRDTTKEGDPPEDIAALGPLFQAIAHGCKARRQQETLEDVYIGRICRRRADGHFGSHAQDRLGAIGPSLAALAWFFDKPFETPHVGLTAEARALVLSSAAICLGLLGRLGEARGPLYAALEMFVAAKSWPSAADAAGKLCVGELAFGDTAAATSCGARSVGFADESADKDRMIVARAYFAAALAAAGEAARARALFAEAEALHEKRQAQYPRLFSVEGPAFWDLLLGERRFAEVAERGAYALALSEHNQRPFDISLGRLHLGRAALGLAFSAATPGEREPQLSDARRHLDIAVAELRRSNVAIYIPRGYLARARLWRAEGDFDGAQRDLDEVLEIAEPGPMRLHLCDMHIELCRLALTERDGFAPLSPSPPTAVTGEARDKLTQTARQELDKAAVLIKECGYDKRNAERDELYEVVAGKRVFRDLPIHV